MSTVSTKGDLERIFEPHWAGGWIVSRYLFVFSALIGLITIFPLIPDAYAPADMVFASGIYCLNKFVTFTPTIAYCCWGLAILGLILIARGGTLFRLGIVLWFIGEWSLLSAEALNVKAYNRLFLWIAIAMLFSPAGEKSLETKYRSPFSRYILIIVFSALYLSTGMTKLLHESEWLDGSAMMFTLSEQYHAGGWLALQMAKLPLVCFVMAWTTLLFEILFPVLIWFRKANPWLLLIGAGFHLGMFPFLNVGHFPFVVLTAYPILLHPEISKTLWFKIRNFRSSKNTATSL